MKKSSLAVVIILIVLVAAGTAYYFNQSPAPVSTPTPPAPQPDLVITSVQEKPRNQYVSDYIVTVQNKGQADAIDAFTVCMWDDKYVPTTSSPCNNGKLANYDEAKMAPAVLRIGTQLVVTFESINGVATGKTLYFVADKSNDPQTNNSVDEADETNNSYTFTRK